MRSLYLKEIDCVSGADQAVAEPPADYGTVTIPEIVVTAYKPLITFIIPNTTVLTLNADVMPSISTGVKVNVNVSSFINSVVANISSAITSGDAVSSSTASGRIPSSKIVGNMP